jgi:hypothetical protein
MDEKMAVLTAAVLRNVFPKQCASVGDGQLYRLLSEEVVFTRPPDGFSFDQHSAIEILKVAAPYVPLIITVLKALKPEERRTSKEAEEHTLSIVIKMPESAKLNKQSPDALKRLVSRCVNVALKNWAKL